MAKGTVAVFCMPEDGHFKLMRPVISGLVGFGFTVIVFTHRRYGAEVVRCGATLADLFAGRPVESVDATSIPVPSRYVSFAAHHVEDVLAELRAVGPVLIVYETFAVIGRLVARLLGIPHVNVSPGHNYDPVRYLADLSVDPRVSISERCHRAVETLRERFGMTDASPFSYITGLSPWLNLCCQPPAFLTMEERAVFEPLAFFGCLPAPSVEDETRRAAHGTQRDLRIYAAFGTVVPRYFAAAALGAFRALAECVAHMPGTAATISLGGAALDDDRRDLIRENVRLVDYADQWQALRDADVFLTHHGVNSTHEAILRGVPMLSYPFFTDQPALARRCQEFGIAVPVTDTLRGSVRAEQFRSGLEAVAERQSEIRHNLAIARAWELEVMAGRPAVLRRMADLAGVREGGP